MVCRGFINYETLTFIRNGVIDGRLISFLRPETVHRVLRRRLESARSFRRFFQYSDILVTRAVDGDTLVLETGDGLAHHRR